MSKVKNTNYLALSAMLRAREARMLNRERCERLLSEPTFADAARALTDSGYEDMSGMDSRGINESLEKHRVSEIADVYEMAPDKAVVDLFRLKYDYHNAKVLVKSGGGAGEKAQGLFSGSGRFPVEALVRAYEQGENPELPAELNAAIDGAKVTLARTGNPQLADFVLDKAYFAEMEALAKQIGDPYVTGYVRLLIDSANLRTAVRVQSLDSKLEKLTMALIPGGEVDPAAIMGAMDSREALNSLYASTAFAKAVEAEGMTSFELAADNAVNGYLADSERIAFGPAAVLGYLAAVENEIQAIRIILTGRLTGIDTKLLRERLRDSYV